MRAKVWNDNIYPYSEKFKGDLIKIEPNSFIEMDYDEAIMFKGTFSSIVRDADGHPKQESWKKIRVEPIGNPVDAVIKTDPNKCLACGKVLGSQAELAKHIFDEHPAMLDQESKDDAIANLNKMKASQGKGR
jgi:hypothetical protein